MERADERLCADGCVCVCVGSISVRIHPAESLAFTMNSLLTSHSPTCFSLLGLILLQQELNLKVTAVYWMLSEKADKIGREARRLSGFIKCSTCSGNTWNNRLGVLFCSPSLFLGVWEDRACRDLGTLPQAVEGSWTSQTLLLEPISSAVCVLGCSRAVDALLQ